MHYNCSILGHITRLRESEILLRLKWKANPLSALGND